MTDGAGAGVAQENSVAQAALPEVRDEGLPPTLEAVAQDLDGPASGADYEANAVPAATLESIDRMAAFWREQLDALRDAMVGALGEAAELAAEGLSMGDAAAYSSARTTAKLAFAKAGEACRQASEARAEAEAVRADFGTDDTRALELLLGPRLAATLDFAFRASGFAEGFTPRAYDGGPTLAPLADSELFTLPGLALDPRVVRDAWEDWHRGVASTYDGPVHAAAEIRAFASSLLAVGDSPSEYFAALDEHGAPRDDGELPKAPMAGWHGSARDYVDAVFASHATPAWASWYAQNATHTKDQIGLQDAQGDADFDVLDAGIERILTEGKSKSQDDDVVMDMLNLAQTGPERTYMLQRLLHAHGPEGQRMYFEVQRRLDGEEVDEFDAYRDEAGAFGADSVGGEVEEASAAAAGLDAIQTVPGAYVATVYGTLASLPIVGDVAEGAIGEEARALIDELHALCGVDPRSRRAATNIGIVTGKIVGALATMRMASASASGLRSAHLLDDVQAVKTTLATVYTVADVANNAYQAASGEKVSGEAIGWGERIAAALGAAGAAQGLRASIALQKTPLGLLDELAKVDPTVMRGVRTHEQALRRLKAIEEGMPDPVIKATLADRIGAYQEQILTVGGGVAKSAGAAAKPEAEEEVAKMSDSKVRTQCYQIARADAPIPEVETIRDIVLDGERFRTSDELYMEMDALRAALAAYLSLASDADNTLAGPLSVITLGVGH